MNFIQEMFMIWTHYFMVSLMVLISVAFFSLMERKLLSLIHFRKGPNKVLILGLLQPIADAMKLITKNDSPALWSNYILFYLSPIVMFTMTLTIWVVFPFHFGVSLELSTITLMILVGMMVYGLLISGWSSNSKYALLGSMRSVCQALSYEVITSFLMLFIISAMSTYTIWKFIDSQILLVIMSPILFITFLIAMLAELNRTPFDLSEGESELVSGYSVEYGGVTYTLLFLSENTMVFVSSFMVSFFFFTKFAIFIPLMWAIWSLIICLIRGMLPRIRYDYLMMMCWLILLPITLYGFSMNLILVAL